MQYHGCIVSKCSRNRPPGQPSTYTSAGEFTLSIRLAGQMLGPIGLVPLSLYPTLDGYWNAGCYMLALMQVLPNAEGLA